MMNVWCAVVFLLVGLGAVVGVLLMTMPPDPGRLTPSSEDTELVKGKQA